MAFSWRPRRRRAGAPPLSALPSAPAPPSPMVLCERFNTVRAASRGGGRSEASATQSPSEMSRSDMASDDGGGEAGRSAPLTSEPTLLRVRATSSSEGGRAGSSGKGGGSSGAVSSTATGWAWRLHGCGEITGDRGELGVRSAGGAGGGTYVPSLPPLNHTPPISCVPPAVGILLLMPCSPPMPMRIVAWSQTVGVASMCDDDNALAESPRLGILEKRSWLAACGGDGSSSRPIGLIRAEPHFTLIDAA
mmetsp:Transcript_54348/g.140375  ORF Transcript_54348/g.140375 Transcript_54348/m.140375 type:complete len:249 (+) Transcript_54348:810-1556(+)